MLKVKSGWDGKTKILDVAEFIHGKSDYGPVWDQQSVQHATSHNHYGDEEDDDKVIIMAQSSGGPYNTQPFMLKMN